MGQPLPAWCVVIPFFNHAGSIGTVLEGVKTLGLRCYLVDDGSDADSESVLAALADREGAWLRLLQYRPNQGKGMAVVTGLRAAAADGYTHAVQIDADGQHDSADARRLLELSQRDPSAMITGFAVFDASVPRSRLYGRYVTHVWVWINTLSLQIRDTMCGLRVYPLADTLAAWRGAGRFWLLGMGKRMSFDTEILVRLYWRGVRIVNVPVPVTYPLDGVSHFRLWRDNLQLSGAHARMFVGMLWRSPLLLLRLARRHLAGAAA